MSDKTAEAAWAEAFAKAQGAMSNVRKTKTAKIQTKSGPGYSYSYADLADVIEAARKPLADNGLSVAQSVETQQGTVAVTTRIYHLDGHVETFGPLHLGSGNSAQDVGGAVTYARRYALSAALNIASDDDVDGQGAEAPKRSGAKNRERGSSTGTGPQEGGEGKAVASATPTPASPSSPDVQEGVAIPDTSEQPPPASSHEDNISLIEQVIAAKVNVNGKRPSCARFAIAINGIAQKQSDETYDFGTSDASFYQALANQVPPDILQAVVDRYELRKLVEPSPTQEGMKV